jgi:hypothetical protein
VAAAVVSEPIDAPMNTPWRQSKLSTTRGTTRARRPPKRIAEMGTPLGSSQRAEIEGQLRAGAVMREFGWAAFSGEAGVQGRFCQSTAWGGGVPMPSHQGRPSGVTATLVKIVSRRTVAIMAGLVLGLVPGATAKKPASGLTA